MTQVLERETPTTEATAPGTVLLRPENKLIFWTRWLLHIESQKVAAAVLFLATMALTGASTALWRAIY